MLNREQVRSFYDRFGKNQDWQRFYEGPAIRDLLAHGAFEKAIPFSSSDAERDGFLF